MERVNRKWGYYEVLAEGEGYKVKRLVFTGGSIRDQRHSERDEHWHCVGGWLTGNVGGEEVDLRRGDELMVPAGWAHKISGVGVAVEIQMSLDGTSIPDEGDIEILE